MEKKPAKAKKTSLIENSSISKSKDGFGDKAEVVKRRHKKSNSDVEGGFAFGSDKVKLDEKLHNFVNNYDGKT